MSKQLTDEPLANELATKLSTVCIEDKTENDGECSQKCCGGCCESEDVDDYGDIESTTPTDFNTNDHIFHINFLRSIQHIPAGIKRYKNGTRKSCTFTNEQMGQIERENKILLQKILSRGPSIGGRPSTNMYGMQSVTVSNASSRISSAAVNRKKRQQKIDFDNDILRKKIERIARRRNNQ